MLDKWIELKKDLPAGLMIIEEKLRPLLEEIHNLNSEDLLELESFIKKYNKTYLIKLNIYGSSNSIS